MAEKTDEEIIKEVGLETSNNDITPEEALEELSLDNDSDKSFEVVTDPNIESNDSESKTKKNDSKNNKDNNSDNNIQEDDKKDEPLTIQKKQPKIYKILMGVVAFLLLILVVGVILYFLGFFDPEKPEKMPEKKVEMKKAKAEIEFDTKDLNKKRLNKKLTMLTKHEIMNRNELEAEEKRIKEEERLKKEAEEKAIAEKKKKEEEKLAAQYAKIEKEKLILEEQQKEIKEKQESFLRMQEEAAMKLEEKRAELFRELEEQKNSNNVMEPIANEEEIPDVEESMVVENKQTNEENKNNTFLSFINVATIKGNLYKEFLDEIEKYDKKISLCRDYKNRIEIFFGPYESNKEREKILDKLLNNGFKESYLIDFTNEEYQKRCKY